MCHLPAVKLASLASEHPPAQCVVLRRRNIYGSAVAQAIRADMTVRLYGGSGENRKRRQEPEKCDGCGYFHARSVTAATAARETLADRQVFSLNGIAAAGSLDARVIVEAA
jgi:hypothetical protein